MISYRGGSGYATYCSDDEKQWHISTNKYYRI